MSLRGALPPILALALFAGCAPVLSGAACTTDCNCPSAQRCLKNPDGGNGACGDGANYCGKDAGPALLGTLTLNGGIPKPPNNAATVYAWDHQPLVLDDGGFEAALLTAAVDSDGTWGMEQAAPGTAYWLVGQYVMNPLKQGFSVAAQATADGNLVTVDVPTLTCAVSTLRTAPGATATIQWAGALVDLPDINNGLELVDAGVNVSAGSAEVAMQLRTVQLLFPYVMALRYTYAPAANTPAAQNYTFKVKASGYSTGVLCEVTPHPLEHVPSLTTAINPWPLDAGLTVGFTPPNESNVSIVGIDDSSMNPIMLPSTGVNPQIYPTGTTHVDVTIPAGTVSPFACPGTAQCTFAILSARFTREGPGTSEDTSLSSTPFSTP